MDLKRQLQGKLKDAGRIALLGVGSELRGDDIAGILVADLLKEAQDADFRVFPAASAPENFTGKIKKFNPTHLIIVDSLDAGKKAGEVMVVEPDKISPTSFCTHQLSIKIMIDYLYQALDCRIILIGIQPKAIKFRQACSLEVKKSAEYISEAIKQIRTGGFNVRGKDSK
jgi:hydrogenase 3 maturation protease